MNATGKLTIVLSRAKRNVVDSIEAYAVAHQMPCRDRGANISC